MSTALIIYGSTTGNTEEMAEMVREELEKQDIQTEVKEVTDATVDDLTSDHDLLVLGCPAYGDDEIELQEDFVDFYEQMDGVDLKGKSFAVFAPGDSSYEHFCGSVDMLEDIMQELGSRMAIKGLKIDGDPGDFESEIKAWADSLSDVV